MVAIAQQERKDTNKHRKELLALLLLLATGYQRLIERHTAEMMGALLRLADAEGKIGMDRLNSARMLIRSGMVGLASQAMADFNEAVIPAAHYGIEMAGGGAAQYGEAHRAADDVVVRGALGVAFSAIVANAVLQTANNYTGAISRAVVSGATIKAAQDEIDAAAQSLTKKLSSQAQLNINAVFVAATRTTAASTNIASLTWRIFPALENHCKVCLGRDGNSYPVDDPVWKDLPVHNHCGCWGEPDEETA